MFSQFALLKLFKFDVFRSCGVGVKTSPHTISLNIRAPLISTANQRDRGGPSNDKLHNFFFQVNEAFNFVQNRQSTGKVVVTM